MNTDIKFKEGEIIDFPFKSPTIELLEKALVRIEANWPDECGTAVLGIKGYDISEAYFLLEQSLPYPWNSIPAYNDCDSTRKEDMINLFKRAIQLANK